MKLRAKVIAISIVEGFTTKRLVKLECYGVVIELTMRPHELRAFSLGRWVDIDLKPVKK